MYLLYICIYNFSILLGQTSTTAQSETVLPTVINERSSDSVSDVTAYKHISCC